MSRAALRTDHGTRDDQLARFSAELTAPPAPYRHPAAPAPTGPSRADLAALNRLGPVLATFGGRRVTLTWVAGDGYYMDWRDAENRYFMGHGSTPSEAYEAALVKAAPADPLTTVAAGCAVDAEDR